MPKATKYLVFDTETATLPFLRDWEYQQLTDKQRKNVAIAKPLVYDIGWTICNRKGEIEKRETYLVAETFSVPSIFNTAYYKEKRPLYLQDIRKKVTTVLPWENIAEILLTDLETVDYIAAYNIGFDRRAVNFTERYIAALYSPNYQSWEQAEREKCDKIIAGEKPKNPNFNPLIFSFRNREFKMIDIWGEAVRVLLNNRNFRRFCFNNKFISASGEFFSTSAETTFSYLMRDNGFTESHTALADAEIETAILAKCAKRCAIKPGIMLFPFRELGTTYQFLKEEKTTEATRTETIMEILNKKIKEVKKEGRDTSAYYKKILNKYTELAMRLEEIT